MFIVLRMGKLISVTQQVMKDLDYNCVEKKLSSITSGPQKKKNVKLPKIFSSHHEVFHGCIKLFLMLSELFQS